MKVKVMLFPISLSLVEALEAILPLDSPPLFR